MSVYPPTEALFCFGIGYKAAFWIRQNAIVDLCKDNDQQMIDVLVDLPSLELDG